MPSPFLPAAMRSSSRSMPWSAEFLIKCINGSEISSTMVLSISVSSPVKCKLIFFPVSRAKSLTNLGNLLNTNSIGTIRTFITSLCISDVTLARYSMDSRISPSSVDNCSILFFIIINSLTMFINLSSRCMSTLIVLIAEFFLVNAAFPLFLYCLAALSFCCLSVVPWISKSLAFISSISTCSISDMDIISSKIFSFSSLVMIIKVNARSKDPFSMSSDGGSEYTICECCSRALNTMYALAPFNIHWLLS